jgi:hypothetical protein
MKLEEPTLTPPDDDVVAALGAQERQTELGPTEETATLTEDALEAPTVMPPGAAASYEEVLDEPIDEPELVPPGEGAAETAVDSSGAPDQFPPEAAQEEITLALVSGELVEPTESPPAGIE